MTYRALLTVEAPLSPDDLRRDFEAAGIDIVGENNDALTLARDVLRLLPDIVIAVSPSPSAALFEAARMLGTLAPTSFIVFTSDGDLAKIELAAGAGVHAYVVDGYARHRLPAVVQVALARFRREQDLRGELSGLTQRFEERKIIDRAKGMLMRSRGVTEEEAFELLRSLAMRSRQRIGVVATSVIDMSRAGEAVNRSGQLRMLSQRIVKCYAQALAGLDTPQALEAMRLAIARTGANLDLLRKAISTAGYGELVERVAAARQEVLALCADAPDAKRLADLDARAETMLQAAETLTEFLESSGLVASLHIVNVSGRQRMLSQRIAKQCFLIERDPSGERLTQLRESTRSFQAGLDFLRDVPLSSPAILSDLESVAAEWSCLSTLLASPGQADALKRIGGASDRLLEALERLTDRHEQAMQVLIGDRIGRMKSVPL